MDYRDVDGRFDRIVSVGMFEHVGVGFYDTFFGKCANLLADDGVMLLHTIGRSGPPSITNPWIAKYIFPGGYIPALSEVLPAIERAHLIVTDVEVLQLHYAETLKAWRERFLAHRDEVVAALRSALCPNVGILSRLLGDGVPRGRYGRIPNPDGQAQGSSRRRRAITSRAKRRACAASKPAIPRRCDSPASSSAASACRRLASRADRQLSTLSRWRRCVAGKGAMRISHCPAARLSTKRGCVTVANTQCAAVVE